MTTIPPPMASFMLYHRAMRADARRLVAALDAGRDTTALNAWFGHFRTACVIHAEGEDKVLWPALLGERPSIAGAVSVMEAEHVALTDTLDDLQDALREARVDDARELAAELVEQIDAHLDREEDEPVTAVVEAFGVEEIADLMRQIQQSAGPDGAAIALPFFLFHATDAEREALLSAVPPPVREGYETSWRDRYAALASILT